MCVTFQRAQRRASIVTIQNERRRFNLNGAPDRCARRTSLDAEVVFIGPAHNLLPFSVRALNLGPRSRVKACLEAEAT